ncbi:MAG: hypothetical protein ACJ07L_04040 [Opitutales bacterium]
MIATFLVNTIVVALSVFINYGALYRIFSTHASNKDQASHANRI